jgi:hypothetical protein
MNLCKRIIKLFRTTVSIETASIPDWIAVPTLCTDISEKKTRPFKQIHRKQSQEFKFDEFGGHKNSSSNNTGYWFGRTRKRQEKVKWGIVDVRAGAILFKPG